MKFPRELIGFRSRTPSQVRLIGIARKKRGKIRPAFCLAGACGQFVGERFIVGESLAPRRICGAFEAFQGAGGRAVVPGNFCLQYQPLGFGVRCAGILPAFETLEAALGTLLPLAGSAAQADQALGKTIDDEQR